MHAESKRNKQKEQQGMHDGMSKDQDVGCCIMWTLRLRLSLLPPKHLGKYCLRGISMNCNAQTMGGLDRLRFSQEEGLLQLLVPLFD